MIQNNVVDVKTIEWSELKTYEFNSLKSADNRDISKLKNAIINSGFNFPFYVWHGHRYVIDGKGRDIALHELEKEGHKIPPLPIIEIKAESKSMAKRLVLQASSNHGQVTPESFEEFTLDLELEPLDFEMFDLGVGELSLDIDDGIDNDSDNVNEVEMPELRSGDREPFQQMTFTLHDDQVEQIRAACDIAKKMGEFDSINENSNGNALARVCETFITDYGNS